MNNLILKKLDDEIKRIETLVQIYSERDFDLANEYQKKAYELRLQWLDLDDKMMKNELAQDA